MSTKPSTIDRSLLRISAILLIAGVLLSFLAGSSHPDHADANDHAAAFTEYANSSNWTAVHFGQFAGMGLLISGLLVLFFALNLPLDGTGWAGRFGFIAAIVALGLYAVLQAVDGVALKKVADAWMAAPEAEKAARFASAETIRWLEWSVRSYQSFVLGISFLLFAAAIIGTVRLPRLIGCLMGISGLAYSAQGWILGIEGFSETNTVPLLLGIVSILGWSLWILIFAWRMKDPVRAQDSQPGFEPNRLRRSASGRD